LKAYLPGQIYENLLKKKKQKNKKKCQTCGGSLARLRDTPPFMHADKETEKALVRERG
jgi:ribosomal protein L34E